jgi:hypothetical protein
MNAIFLTSTAFIYNNTGVSELRKANTKTPIKPHKKPPKMKRQQYRSNNTAAIAFYKTKYFLFILIFFKFRIRKQLQKIIQSLTVGKKHTAHNARSHSVPGPSITK